MDKFTPEWIAEQLVLAEKATTLDGYWNVLVKDEREYLITSAQNYPDVLRELERLRAENDELETRNTNQAKTIQELFDKHPEDAPKDIVVD